MRMSLNSKNKAACHVCSKAALARLRPGSGRGVGDRNRSDRTARNDHLTPSDQIDRADVLFAPRRPTPEGFSAPWVLTVGRPREKEKPRRSGVRLMSFSVFRTAFGLMVEAVRIALTLMVPYLRPLGCDGHHIFAHCRAAVLGASTRRASRHRRWARGSPRGAGLLRGLGAHALHHRR